MAILNRKKNDPILLTAVCTISSDIFESDTMVSDEENMLPYYEHLNNFRELLPYIGGTKY